jgi:hypothetical protein
MPNEVMFSSVPTKLNAGLTGKLPVETLARDGTKLNGGLTGKLARDGKNKEVKLSL